MSARTIFISVAFGAVFLVTLIGGLSAQNARQPSFQIIRHELDEYTVPIEFAVPEPFQLVADSLAPELLIHSLPDSSDLVVHGVHEGTDITLLTFERQINFRSVDFASLFSISNGFEIVTGRQFEKSGRLIYRAEYQSIDGELNGVLVLLSYGSRSFIFLASGGDNAGAVADLFAHSVSFSEDQGNFMGGIEEYQLGMTLISLPSPDEITFDEQQGNALSIFRENPETQEADFLVSAIPKDELSGSAAESSFVNRLQSAGLTIVASTRNAGVVVFELTNETQAESAARMTGYFLEQEDTLLMGLSPSADTEPNLWLEARFYFEELRFATE